MKNLIFILIALIFSACSSDSGAYRKSDNIINHLTKNIPRPWNEISSEGSDYALQNANSKSIFLFNSSCRKYEASSLSVLTSSILTGIEDLKITDKKNTSYQNREAAEVTANGKLDGIARFFKIITLQKNNCIYDYILIATSSKNLENDSGDLKIFLERIILN